MSRIEIFEPAPTCVDGVCTMGDNEDLQRISTMVASLVDDGWDITCYDPTTAPDLYTDTLAVARLMKEKGDKVLPITLVDGHVKKTGEYPSSLEMGNWLMGRD